MDGNQTRSVEEESLGASEPSGRYCRGSCQTDGRRRSATAGIIRFGERFRDAETVVSCRKRSIQTCVGVLRVIPTSRHQMNGFVVRLMGRRERVVVDVTM